MSKDNNRTLPDTEFKHLDGLLTMEFIPKLHLDTFTKPMNFQMENSTQHPELKDVFLTLGPLGSALRKLKGMLTLELGKAGMKHVDYVRPLNFRCLDVENLKTRGFITLGDQVHGNLEGLLTMEITCLKRFKHLQQQNTIGMLTFRFKLVEFTPSQYQL